MAVGRALAGERVVCVVGDGSTLYCVQALWTAARHDVPFNLTDISNGSIKALLTAGAPSTTGHDEEQVLRTLRPDLGQCFFQAGVRLPEHVQVGIAVADDRVRAFEEHVLRIAIGAFADPHSRSQRSPSTARAGIRGCPFRTGSRKSTTSTRVRS